MGTVSTAIRLVRSLDEVHLVFAFQVDSDQRNYGIAVTDVDRDGDFEIFVAGFTGPNLVLKYNEEMGRLENIAEHGGPYEKLMDRKGQAIGE